MDAVAARAVGCQRRTILRGQTVVAVKERLHAVRRKVILGVHSLRGVAAAADLNGYLHRRAVLERLDLVLGVAIGAGRRVALTGGYRFAMYAFFHILGRLFVARAAGLGQPGEMERRSRRRRRQNGVPVVAVAAVRRAFLPLGQGKAMNAGAVARRLFHMARSAIGRLRRDVVVGVLARDVRVATRAGVSLVDGGGELGQIDKQGNLLAGGIGLGERLISVALQAGAVLNRFGSGRGRQQPIKGKKCCGQ